MAVLICREIERKFQMLVSSSAFQIKGLNRDSAREFRYNKCELVLVKFVSSEIYITCVLVYCIREKCDVLSRRLSNLIYHSSHLELFKQLLFAERKSYHSRVL